MDNEKIYNHFAKSVDDYDYVADKVVMRNNELHKVMVNALNFGSKSKLKILDLGSGTGHGMFLMLKKFLNAKVTGIDFSHKMITNSREKLKGYNDRIKLIEDDFNKIDFDNDYDAIVSAIAIYNINHQEKAKLFQKIYGSLKDGGIFVNADFIKGEESEITEQYSKIYENYLRKNLSGGELEVWLKHAFKEDMPMSLSGQFDLLTKASFLNIELVWQFNNLAVYVAQKIKSRGHEKRLVEL